MSHNSASSLSTGLQSLISSFSPSPQSQRGKQTFAHYLPELIYHRETLISICWHECLISTIILALLHNKLSQLHMPKATFTHMES